MYHISKNIKKTKRTHFVLLEHLPTILSPKILVLTFLYAMAFTLLLLGLRILRFETTLSDSISAITSTSNTPVDSLLYHSEDSTKIQRNIASQVIRLHVVANSDTKEDQALKLQVRDSIIHSLQEQLSNSHSVQEARNTILSRIPEIEKKAQDTITREGFSYPVKVTLGNRYFPIKDYGDLRFPAGNYEALCVSIGAASGHNWWCVLFPSLCFVDETHAVVPDDSKDKLRKSLTKDEYDSLEIHSAIYDALLDNP